ncbi:hypothetical protein IJM86_06320 [bacterium]|nr:hypothetical protein [bacterium]
MVDLISYSTKKSQENEEKKDKLNKQKKNEKKPETYSRNTKATGNIKIEQSTYTAKEKNKSE